MATQQRALIATEDEAAGNGSAKVCWALIGAARADNFASANLRLESRAISGSYVLTIKKSGLVRTSARKTPVILHP